MKRYIVIGILLLVVFQSSGCVSNRYLADDQVDLIEVNDYLRKKRVKIELVSGKVIYGKELQIGIDSSSYIDEYGSSRQIYTESLDRVSIERNASEKAQLGSALIVAGLGSVAVGLAVRKTRRAESIQEELGGVGQMLLSGALTIAVMILVANHVRESTEDEYKIIYQGPVSRYTGVLPVVH